jgi:competence protein ComEA
MSSNGSEFREMRRKITTFLAGLSIYAALSTFAKAQQKLPNGPGRDTMIRICSACHSPENVVGMAKTREEWGALVGEMAAEGAQGTDEEFNEIVDYLATNFPKAPKINVNKATASDLAGGLELTSKEADAIVHYREEKGSFKSIEDVEKVPGIDAKKLEAKKDRLSF